MVLFKNHALWHIIIILGYVAFGWDSQCMWLLGLGKWNVILNWCAKCSYVAKSVIYVHVVDIHICCFQLVTLLCVFVRVECYHWSVEDNIHFSWVHDDNGEVTRVGLLAGAVCIGVGLRVPYRL